VKWTHVKDQQNIEICAEVPWVGSEVPVRFLHLFVSSKRETVGLEVLLMEYGH